MSDFKDLRKINLHYEGMDMQDHSVPANVLANSLQQVQRILYLLAKSHRGLDHNSRVRVSREMEHLFALNCRVPKAGSYALPVDIGDPSMFSPGDDEIEQVCQNFHHVSQALMQSNLGTLREYIPDTGYQSVLIAAYKKIQPSQRSGIVLSIEDYNHKKIVDGFRLNTALNRLDNMINENNRKYHESDIPTYITCTLDGMEFQSRRLILKLLDGRTLKASYQDNFEPELVVHRRRQVQLRGNAEYNDKGVLVSLSLVDHIIPIDESKIELHEIAIDNKRYQAATPLIFNVVYDREDCIYDLEGDFGIILFADTRPELEEDLNEAIAVLWNEIACEKPTRLSPQARNLRKEMQNRLRDIRNGI